MQLQECLSCARHRRWRYEGGRRGWGGSRMSKHFEKHIPGSSDLNIQTGTACSQRCIPLHSGAAWGLQLSSLELSVFSLVNGMWKISNTSTSRVRGTGVPDPAGTQLHVSSAPCLDVIYTSVPCAVLHSHWIAVVWNVPIVSLNWKRSEIA